MKKYAINLDHWQMLLGSNVSVAVQDPSFPVNFFTLFDKNLWFLGHLADE